MPLRVLAFLHDGHPVVPHEVWGAWSLEPGVLFGLALTAALYGRGAARLRPGCRSRRAAAFWGGWGLLALSLISPLHRMGEALLWAHMTQHELLMVAAAPLLVLGRPLPVMLRALPSAWRRRLGRWSTWAHPTWRALTRVEVAWGCHALVLLGWHVPALYERTLSSDLVHSVQHLGFLGAALLFWWSVLPGGRSRLHHGAAVLSLFTTAVLTAGLGALLTIARAVWYPSYGSAALAWGLTPLEDQQLAGIIMWVPGGLSYLLATIWLVAAWLRESEIRVERRGWGRAGTPVRPEAAGATPGSGSAIARPAPPPG